MKRILIIFVLCFAYTMTLAQGAGGNRASDSLALIAFYNSTDGDNWTNSWELADPINTWRGITVASDRVTRIELNSNRLSGSIPSELGNLSELTSLTLNSNELSGSIPSELGNLIQLTSLELSNNFFTELPNLSGLSNLTTFEVQTNYLDFEGILPNIGRLSMYAPQRPVREGVRYDLASGDELLLSVNIGGTGNQYQWYKDEVAIMSSNNDTFRIANVIPSDAGLYRCEITNPGVPNLALISIADTLSVSYNKISDSLALVALYNSTNGDHWYNRWTLAKPINTWFGVTLNEDRVATLQLEFTNLNGSIPSELGNLSELTSLNLNSNELSGSIPSELGNLSKLTELFFKFNQLSGSIPSELGNLILLTRLNLNVNQLSGSIPSELGNLIQLRSLALNNNQLSGSIPSELRNLTQLTSLFLNTNELNGSIPSELWDELILLIRLELNSNQLSGSIPSELRNLRELIRLNLSSNELNGSIPSELGNLPQLRQLFLNSNQLSGSIPSELRNLSKLTELNLSSNELSGPIPSELGNLSKLISLTLDSNQLSGSIPSELGMLTRLTSLELSNNFFTELPDLNISNRRGVRFEVQNNYLDFEDLLPNIGRLTTYAPQRPVREGMRYDDLTIGDELLLSVSVGGTGNQYQWYKDSVTIMNSNNDTFRIASIALSDGGLYHCEITNPGVLNLALISIADTLSVSYNRLSDSLALVALYNSTDGANWTNSWNLADSSINTWHGVSLNDDEDRVDTLQLSSNNLNGFIPRELSSLDQLQYLNLADNQLSGSIPPEMSNLIQLLRLDLSSNQLSGSIPSELRNLSELIKLTLDSNQLSGSIPSELGNLRELRNLDLSSNELNGSIPSELGNLRELRNLFLNSNELNGSIPSELGELTRLRMLILHTNELNGSIPIELGKLMRLTKLDLANNQLSGSIPLELGDLAKLNRLILKDNLLTDTIPKELGKLTNLYLLNLARNSLTGTIPPQLGNFPRMTNFVLSSNKLSGAIPEELGNLTKLWQLRLYDNFFTSLPDLSHINLPDAFEVYLNHLDFEDILPNLCRLRPFRFHLETLPRYRSYNPQRPLREGQKYELSEGDDLVLRINKVKGENNQYQWYKNDIPISDARDTSISLTDVNLLDAGLYYCKVTHPRFGITFLRSSEDTIVISDSDLGGRLSAQSASYSSEEEEMSVQVYPNPVVGGTIFIRVEHRVIDAYEPITAIFYNLVGIEVYREENILLSGDVSYEWSLGDLSRGIYILRLFIDDRVIERHIMMK